LSDAVSGRVVAVGNGRIASDFTILIKPLAKLPGLRLHKNPRLAVRRGCAFWKNDRAITGFTVASFHSMRQRPVLKRIRPIPKET
jgi:hypothetical protein